MTKTNSNKDLEVKKENLTGIDWNSIEEKWTERWEKQHIFESDPDLLRKKYYVTVAYPYPNSPQHIGHGRTYVLADVHARYMRMKGYNVLFPMGFHYTGTPILAMSRRVISGDKELLETFHNVYHVPREVITTFAEPAKIAEYFHKEIKTGMKEVGFSIDWRREFTTVDEAYSKFITWQFNTFRKKGLIIQGSHPVGWCPNDQNPVSQHDTMGDVEPEFNEYTLIKFRLRDGYIIPTATLRPETLYGATNLWANPTIDYVKIYLKDKNEKWIVSREAASKLPYLNHEITVESHILGRDLIGTLAANPITGISLPLYPASFVEADSGTGFVMSVPAHAPYDYQALEELKNNSTIRNEFNLKEIDIEPIKVIESDDYLGIYEIPSRKILNKQKIQKNAGLEIEKLTDELYSHEFYKGRMLQIAGRYAGMTVLEAKDKIKSDIVRGGAAEIMFDLSSKSIRCRCGTKCVVKILNDQWFLDYKNSGWKHLAHECLSNMDLIPGEIRLEFTNVIDWLRERACTRRSGLGTKLPWDREWIIESLSDSVIYMAYYILAKYVNNRSIRTPDSLTDSFFDFVFLGRGNLEDVARGLQMPAKLLSQIRDEFLYFYPVDSRHSGRDLVPNHLSFFVFGHVAIFDKDRWPKQIVVNGSVLMGGKKMSKSLRNIIPLRDAVRENSADAIRLAMLISAELLQDADFSLEAVKGIRSRLDALYDSTIKNFKPSLLQLKQERINEELEDKWLLSRLQRIIEKTTWSMDRLRVREALLSILYSMDHDLQWYDKRVKAKKREGLPVLYVRSMFIDARIRMLAPFAPFISEEIWEITSNTRASIMFSEWPTVDKAKEDVIAEESEELIKSIIMDIQKIIKVVKIKPNRIFFYAAARWKFNIYSKILAILSGSNLKFGDIIKILVRDPEAAVVKNNLNIVRKMVEDILSEPIETRKRRLQIGNFSERSTIEDAESLIRLESDNLDAKISVYFEDESDVSSFDPKLRAKTARPFKPAIYLTD